MDLATQHLRCPNCGAHLDGGERDTYACSYCGTSTPRTALTQPPRAPISTGIDRLWKAVGADFDQDGWFEICGWHEKQLHAIDPIDRVVMWTLGGFADEHDLYAGPGRVYVASDGELTAINAYTGARVWTLSLMNVREVHDPGYLANGVIWARTHEDKLVAIDRATGARRGTSSAYDSASLFRTIVGSRMVVNDAYGLYVLDATRDGIVLKVGGDLRQLEKDLDAGRQLTSVPATVESAVVHRGVLYAVVDADVRTLVAYRVADGRIVARREISRDRERLVAAVAGHPVTGSDSTLRREPDGPSWSPTGDDEPEIESVQGAGNVLVVHVKRTGPGSDRNSLVGLDAATLSPVWQVDDLGHLMSEIICRDDRIVFDIDLGGGHKLVALDPASGATLWETAVPSETGVQVGGGLVIQSRIGTALLAETGELLFPKDTRTSTPAPPIANLPEELPTWGALQQAAPASSGDSKVMVWIAAAIAAIAAVVVFAVTR